jgi:hypothetical protein
MQYDHIRFKIDRRSRILLAFDELEAKIGKKEEEEEEESRMDTENSDIVLEVQAGLEDIAYF